MRGCCSIYALLSVAVWAVQKDHAFQHGLVEGGLPWISLCHTVDRRAIARREVTSTEVGDAGLDQRHHLQGLAEQPCAAWGGNLPGSSITCA